MLYKVNERLLNSPFHIYIKGEHKMKKVLKFLEARGDINVIEYFFVAVLVVVGITVVLFKYL